MKIIKQSMLWLSAFLLICSGNFCSHKMAYNKSEFGYNLLMNGALETDGQVIAEEITAVSSPGKEPLAITWDSLKNVKYVVKFNKQYQMDFQYPVFSPDIKKISGKELYISGYLIPFDVNQGLYAISRNPYSSCYFCGKSGPESIVSLKFKTKPPKYKVDAFKRMKGTLFLNDTNPMDFIYIFTNAEEYKGPEK
jgi:hypothetical protein